MKMTFPWQDIYQHPCNMHYAPHSIYYSNPHTLRIHHTALSRLPATKLSGSSFSRKKTLEGRVACLVAPQTLWTVALIPPMSWLFLITLLSWLHPPSRSCRQPSNNQTRAVRHSPVLLLGSPRLCHRLWPLFTRLEQEEDIFRGDRATITYQDSQPTLLANSELFANNFLAIGSFLNLGVRKTCWNKVVHFQVEYCTWPRPFHLVYWLIPCWKP